MCKRKNHVQKVDSDAYNTELFNSDLNVEWLEHNVEHWIMQFCLKTNCFCIAGIVYFQQVMLMTTLSFGFGHGQISNFYICRIFTFG